MAVNAESLKKQLAETEAEFEQVKATIYRYDGVIQLLKKLIADADAEAEDNTKDT